MAQNQAFHDGAVQGVQDRGAAAPGGPAKVTDPAAGREPGAGSGQPARSLLSPPAPPVQRRSLFRR